jgi:hypothetical protein
LSLTIPPFFSSKDLLLIMLSLKPQKAKPFF